MDILNLYNLEKQKIICKKIILMKQFETSTLSKLTLGDRFYFPTKKDKVCESLGIVNKGFRIVYCYYDHNDDLINTEINRKVVFLRNINTK